MSERVVFRKRQQVHVERIERQRASVAGFGRVPEQHETRIAVAVIHRMLADAVRHHLAVGDGMDRTVHVRRKMGAAMPAPVGCDRIDAVRQFEFVDGIHQGVGLRCAGGRESRCGQKGRADDHDVSVRMGRTVVELEIAFRQDGQRAGLSRLTVAAAGRGYCH
ncbi:hypothetical protein [Paraburkholderia sp. SUR17]|uniref:hypothetical protein n=1 Tax=Paraburkholderia sp. SUR17 TaxID=3034358 RepID=UPI0024080866|nr:hypothetical protein [Paraburkholderia sp. SUR17]WEY38614.1 hypothetical protein P2869_16530 [Paraburkholderia sp. SUR17]